MSLVLCQLGPWIINPSLQNELWGLSRNSSLATPKQASPIDVKKSVWAQEKGSRNPRVRAHQTFLNAIAVTSPHTCERNTKQVKNPCSPESRMHLQKRQLSLLGGCRTLPAWAALTDWVPPADFYTCLMWQEKKEQLRDKVFTSTLTGIKVMLQVELLCKKH